MTGAGRPLVTFALFAYNQEGCVRRAVEAAFAQTWRPLEIILSDDCSTDRTFETMREMAAAYDGPHRVVLNRNPVNMGVASHFFAVARMARSEIAVIAAGDDVSLAHRTALSAETLLGNPGLTFMEVGERWFSHDEEIPPLLAQAAEATGVPAGPGSRVTLGSYLAGRSRRLSGAARTVRVPALLSFGPFRPRCPTEDTPSIVRLLLAGEGEVRPECGMLRRRDANSLSAAASLLRMDLAEIGRQHEDDIREAQRAGLIDGTTAGRLIRLCGRRLRRRRIRQIAGNGVAAFGALLRQGLRAGRVR